MLFPAVATSLLLASAPAPTDPSGFTLTAQSGVHTPLLEGVSAGPAVGVAGTFRSSTRFGGELAVDQSLLFFQKRPLFRTRGAALLTFSLDATTRAEVIFAGGPGLDLLDGLAPEPRLAAQLTLTYALSPTLSLRGDVRYGATFGLDFPTDGSFLFGVRFRL